MEEFTEPKAGGTTTKVAVIKHPLHPMTVHFSIAFLFAAVPSDLAYLYWGDPFWARMSLWLVGAGAVGGIVAGIVGTGELLAVEGIRNRAAAWNHFVAAVVMISVAFANWMLRIGDPEGAILPWGLYLSFFNAPLVALAGWLGGGLVYHHQVGILDEDEA